MVEPVLDDATPVYPTSPASWGPRRSRGADRRRRAWHDPKPAERSRMTTPDDRCTTSSSCSTSTTRCSTTTACRPTSSAHLATSFGAGSARPLLGDLRGAARANSATPTISARCSATALEDLHDPRAAADVELAGGLSVRRPALSARARRACAHAQLGPDGDPVRRRRRCSSRARSSAPACGTRSTAAC